MNLSRLFTCSLCLTATVASAKEHWAYGITQSDGNYYGWYDVDKTGNDNGMCYAASAANLVAWWQNGRRKSDLPLPSDVPEDVDDIWGKYKSACKSPMKAVSPLARLTGGFPGLTFRQVTKMRSVVFLITMKMK